MSLRRSTVVMCLASLSLALPAFAGTKTPPKAKKSEPSAPAPTSPAVATPEAAPAESAPSTQVTTTTTTTTTSHVEMAHQRAMPESPEVSSGSYSTIGAASLGSGRALRLQLIADSGAALPGGHIGLQGVYEWAYRESIDMGVSLRLPVSSLSVLPGVGVVPGYNVRWNFVNDGHLHLAVVGELEVPLSFQNSVWVGLLVSPGVTVSYDVTEKAELFTTMLATYQQLLWSNPRVFGTGTPGYSGTLRLGLGYSINETSGVFARAEASAGYQPIKQLIVIGDQFNHAAISLAGVVGYQLRLR